ncbi:MAG: 1,4-alpha-glucan branching enzyme [Actinobacteria bacterium 13_1_40CM_2_65_8]|nr:MAG: 1,4-alpha-glucan branching enzyme [Chloroflexi bacterium 13_1_40CM_65_17]OLC63896.1 MAG: 1,4-alpha-glucan branching enzyme [Actinobacteria bacterium 13_1_40CM_4_65_12]OLD50224.1 MAG: 1,4-alpha-glucan branching enzyme [Actinobacteria bacterium 13_1_40CM_2_65_8]
MIATSLLTPFDLHLFNEGTHSHLYEKLGAHLSTDPEGAWFGVWAPNADAVSVIGDFNGWDRNANALMPREQSGIWEGFIPGVNHGAMYKFHIHSRVTRMGADKADPYAVYAEQPPRQASIVWDLSYDWRDRDWMSSRSRANGRQAPWSVYEVHLGSWMRVPEEGKGWLTYRELAPRLADYAHRLGFTHVEFMPVMEHPFYGSWGYQVTGFFAPTSRYGTPQDFMFLVDHLHQHGIGVILDWVPSHFPSDEFGLQNFDGTHLYEHADPRLGVHPDWGSSIFNYGRNEVRGFLLSSALSWLNRYHADGLRVDAVASMLYLDYSRKPGQWLPNKFGGNENLEAVDFLRRFNIEVYREHSDVQTIAEESTSWPLVSRPTYLGGLGFGMKWDMGWMHDTLVYMSKDPVHRRFEHHHLTFRMVYAFSESYMLPLSHDEVVHGKGSLLSKMPGDDWQKFANLRLLLAYMYAMPGKKLLFMGAEFGQWSEWNHEGSLDWHLLEQPMHGGLSRWTGDLNRVMREEKPLHELDFDPAGFAWIDWTDAEQSVISFLRRSTQDELLIAAFNFTPVPRHNYQIGAPLPGRWLELLNSDAPIYGGSGQGNLGGVDAAPVGRHGHLHSLTLTLPPLGAIFLKPDRGDGGELNE